MKAKYSLIHDTFTLERRYPSAPGRSTVISLSRSTASAGSVPPKTGASVPTASTSAWEARNWSKARLRAAPS